MKRPGLGIGFVAVGLALFLRGVVAAPPVGAASDSVAVVGDSIGRDASALTRSLVGREHTIAHYEAVAAGSVPYHHPRLLQVVAAPAGPDIVIVELGTGDAFYEANEATMERNARLLLRDISPHVDCIRWLDIKNGGTLAYPTVNRYAAGVNRAIHRVVADYPKAEYMHYEAWTRLAGNGYFVSDLLHHNAAGRLEMARIVNQAVDSCDPSLTTGPFWDVRNDYWAAEDIAWMHSAGIASGYPNGTYRALVGGIEPFVTRAEMANFLWRLAGSPTGFPDHPWNDGPAWIDEALDWLAATGTATGYPDRTFRPADRVERGQVASYLWRLTGSPTGFPDHPWNDGAPWIDDAFDWLAVTGIADGYPDGSFRPGWGLTRGSMAHLLHGDAVRPPSAPPTADDTPTDPSTTVTEPPATLDGPPPTGPAPTVPAPPPPSTTVPRTTTTATTTSTTTPPLSPDQ